MPPDRKFAHVIAERSGALEARNVSSTPQADATTLLEPEAWLPPSETDCIEWEAFAVYAHHLAAQIVAGLFENESLPTIVTAWPAFPGFAPATLWVPKHLMHRARWIASLAPPSDAELL